MEGGVFGGRDIDKIPVLEEDGESCLQEKHLSKMPKLERYGWHLRVFPCGQQLGTLGHPDPGSANLLAPKAGLESPHLTGAWPGHLLDKGLGLSLLLLFQQRK